MAERKIVWTKSADIQFFGVLEYWRIRNKSTLYPKKLIKLVSERSNQIAESPFMFKTTDFKNTRVASMGDFSIYFKVTENQIIITAFWDNRQDPDKLLKILKEK